MTKNEAKPKVKSGRKPFRDVSNVGKSSKSLEKKVPQNDESALDRLLLVHCDLSTSINQVTQLKEGHCFHFSSVCLLGKLLRGKESKYLCIGNPVGRADWFRIMFGC